MKLDDCSNFFQISNAIVSQLMLSVKSDKVSKVVAEDN